jgi:hypothetical protein
MVHWHHHKLFLLLEPPARHPPRSGGYQKPLFRLSGLTPHNNKALLPNHVIICSNRHQLLVSIQCSQDTGIFNKKIMDEDDEWLGYQQEVPHFPCQSCSSATVNHSAAPVSKCGVDSTICRRRILASLACWVSDNKKEPHPARSAVEKMFTSSCCECYFVAIAIYIESTVHLLNISFMIAATAEIAV